MLQEYFSSQSDHRDLAHQVRTLIVPVQVSLSNFRKKRALTHIEIYEKWQIKSQGIYVFDKALDGLVPHKTRVQEYQGAILAKF